MTRFLVFDKGAYFDIKFEGDVICRVPNRAISVSGLSDEARAHEIALVFDENRDRILKGEKPLEAGT